MLPCAALAGPPRPAFSFLPFFCPFVLPPCVEGLVFSHPGSPVPRIRPQLAHTPPTGRVCCFAGVVSLPGPQSRTQGHTGASLVFLRRTSLPLPLKGEGLDIAFLWGFGFSLAVAFGNRWPQLAHTGPTGRVCCFGGVVPLPGSHNRTQGRTGPNLVSPSFLGVLLLRKSR